MNPLTRFKHTVPIWLKSLFANNAKELTPFTFYASAYSPADEVLRRNFDVWKIADRIDR
jgi:hypothetical protein